MKRAIVLLGLLLGLGGVGLLARARLGERADPSPPRETPPPPRPARPAGEGAPTLLDQARALAPEERPRSRMSARTSTPARAAVDRAPPPGGAPALVGLEVVNASSDELRGLEVPDGMAGVVVRAVDPASPAAEAALKPGDVIVRAQRDKITSADALGAAVGDRDHTLLTVYRGGHPFQVVLHKPLRRAP